MRWAEISVESPAESAEAVTGFLLEAGCQGVAERGADARVLTGFLPITGGLQAVLDELDGRLRRLPEFGLPAAAGITLRYAEDADWANEWKKYFKPLEIGRRLVIKPS